MFFVFKNGQKVYTNDLGKPFRQARLLVLRLEGVKERLADFRVTLRVDDFPEDVVVFSLIYSQILQSRKSKRNKMLRFTDNNNKTIGKNATPYPRVKNCGRTCSKVVFMTKQRTGTDRSLATSTNFFLKNSYHILSALGK